MDCINCNEPIVVKRKRKYCSTACRRRLLNRKRKLSSTNKTKRNRRRTKRGIPRKIGIITSLGGKCSICNYDKNLSALIFHHLDPSTKLFELSSSNLSKWDLQSIEVEAKKCALLCQNCHSELHNPHLDMRLLLG
jgi:hypothetical protein